MIAVKKILLDVLKPHQPNALSFASAIAAAGADYSVHLTVIEIDKNTETLQIIVTADAIDFDAIEVVIKGMGGSVHSIDEVEVSSEGDTAGAA